MAVARLLTPIPLDLLKIEPIQRAGMELPCLGFIAFILPARIVTGLALLRSRRRAEPHGKEGTTSRWLVGMSMPVVVGVHLLYVYVSQYVSWDELPSWSQQHAVLMPVPLLDSV